MLQPPNERKQFVPFGRRTFDPSVVSLSQDVCRLNRSCRGCYEAAPGFHLFVIYQYA